jgi:catechol 2,3-dioxygenase-like lactoylglutathione lyase family enzyme
MRATSVNPILNVSDFAASVAWFQRLGWEESWAWNDPPTFGGVCSGDVEVFLCQGAQGAPGMWMSVWVDDVDAVYRHCQQAGIEIAQPPSDEPWGVREMHIVHPDRHVFRISQRHPHRH